MFIAVTKHINKELTDISTIKYLNKMTGVLMYPDCYVRWMSILNSAIQGLYFIRQVAFINLDTVLCGQRQHNKELTDISTIKYLNKMTGVLIYPYCYVRWMSILNSAIQGLYFIRQVAFINLDTVLCGQRQHNARCYANLSWFGV